MNREDPQESDPSRPLPKRRQSDSQPDNWETKERVASTIYFAAATFEIVVRMCLQL
ncbi:MAG: hypothetical protein ACK5Q5_15170 [Planctomycetaceae bacterium]